MFFPRGPITYIKIITLTNNWTNLQCGKQLPGPNSVPSNNKSCKYKKKTVLTFSVAFISTPHSFIVSRVCELRLNSSRIYQ